MPCRGRDTMTRLLPDEPLPAYSYVPGFFPHPHASSTGSKYEAIELPCETAWRESRVYLHAIDLFNHGYYWEAHEAWETLWIAAGRRGTTADWFKGLIKLAAGAVKLREGNAAGTQRHARRALELFTSLETAASRSSGLCWGLALHELQQAATQLEMLAHEIDGPAPERQLTLELRPRLGK